jgi:hypothetical protein
MKTRGDDETGVLPVYDGRELEGCRSKALSKNGTSRLRLRIYNACSDSGFIISASAVANRKEHKLKETEKVAKIPPKKKINCRLITNLSSNSCTV